MENTENIDEIVAEMTSTKVKKVREKKAKKEKKKAIDAPKKNSPYQATRWLYHVYDMMKEANVPITDTIIDQFNALMTYLYTLRLVYTSAPQKSRRYESGVELKIVGEAPRQVIYGINLYFESGVSHSDRTAIIQRIAELYAPLYNSIKDIVRPYMKRQNMYEQAMREVEYLKKDLIKTHETLELEEKQHKERMKQCYERARRLQQQIAEQEQRILENKM